MILLYLHGGIGNQMFQYAAARALAEHNHTELKIDKSYYDEHHYKGDELTKFFHIPKFRDILNNFTITAPEATATELLAYRKSLIVRAFQRLLPLNWRNKYIQKGTSFDTRFFSLSRDVFIKGYFQSEKYFAPYADIVKKEFTFQPYIIERNKKVCDVIRSCMSISVHVRRGDYVGNNLANQILGALDEAYYVNAVEYLERKLGSGISYFVFSDDAPWAKENLKMFKNVRFIDDTMAASDVDELYLMSRCQHNIIANSSFSWWAAWLNDNKAKIVIAPKRWYNDPSFKTTDLVPSTWVEI